MDDVMKGFVAGFAATVVLSVLMILKAQMGLLPEFNVIEILARFVGNPGEPLYGWLAHFAVGTLLWGGLFAIASDFIGGTFTFKGLGFGIASWLLMMIVFLPAADLGLFGLELGPMVPVMTLILHIIYGFVLGYVYRALGGTAQTVEKVT